MSFKIIDQAEGGVMDDSSSCRFSFDRPSHAALGGVRGALGPLWELMRLLLVLG